MPTCPKCHASYENTAPLCPKCTVAARAQNARLAKRLSTLETILWISLCAPGILRLLDRGPSAYPTARAIFHISLIALSLSGLIGLWIYRRKHHLKEE